MVDRNFCYAKFFMISWTTVKFKCRSLSLILYSPSDPDNKGKKAKSGV